MNESSQMEDRLQGGDLKKVDCKPLGTTGVKKPQQPALGGQTTMKVMV